MVVLITMKPTVRDKKSDYEHISDLDFIRYHKTVLESLYGTEFLNKYPQKHPAQYHYEMCLNILEKGGMIKWNESQQYYNELLRMTLHTSVTNTIGQGSIGSLKIGDITLYGDESVQRKLKACLNNPLHFNSLMLELSFASYQINKENNVLPLEQENKPDLRVEVEELDFPVFVECKCLKSISENRINSRIKKLTIK